MRGRVSKWDSNKGKWVNGVELYAILRDGKLNQYPEVTVFREEWMPSGGALSNEADRPLVRALEDKMIEVFGKVIVELKCKPGGCVNLFGKMLRPVHMEALGEAVGFVWEGGGGDGGDRGKIGPDSKGTGLPRSYGPGSGNGMRPRSALE